MRVEILGDERRRRWGDEKKLAIVLSVGVDGATVTEVARRHDVTRQQLYSWRSELKKKGLLQPSSEAVFLGVDMSALLTAPLARDHHKVEPEMIELRLNHGRSLRFDGGMDGATLTRLIRVVESA